MDLKIIKVYPAARIVFSLKKVVFIVLGLLRDCGVARYKNNNVDEKVCSSSWDCPLKYKFYQKYLLYESQKYLVSTDPKSVCARLFIKLLFLPLYLSNKINIVE